MALRFFNRENDKKKELLSLTDEQLVAKYARTQDAECLGQLYERYTHLVFSVCMKYLGNEAEAEDMVMMVFEKLFEELKKADVKTFKSWLYIVAKNECLMLLRHNKSVQRSKEEILKELESVIMETGDGEHLVPGNNGSELINTLEMAIQKLNDAQRKCIGLFYLEEQSYKEVSDSTGFSLNEVKSHIQNGKRNLRIILENARES